MFQFQRLSGLFSSIRGAAESEQAQRAASFDELAQRLAGIETSGNGKPPSAAEIKAALEAAGRDAGELEREVGRLVEIHRLQQQVAERAELQEAIRDARQKRQTEVGRFEAQQAKHRERLREIDDEIFRLDARQDAMSQAGAKLAALLGERTPMKALGPGELPIPCLGAPKAIGPDTAAGQAARDLVRWQFAAKVPARCPVDPATIPAQAHLRRVSAQIAEFESEAAKHPDRLIKMPSRLSTEHDKLRAEIARAQKSWDVWHEYQRRQKEVDALAVA